MPEVKAKMYHIEETEHRSGFSFRKFIAITEYDGKYPQYVQFECAGDNTAKLDNVFIDDIVNLHTTFEGEHGQMKAARLFILINWTFGRSRYSNQPGRQR